MFFENSPNFLLKLHLPKSLTSIENSTLKWDFWTKNSALPQCDIVKVFLFAGFLTKFGVLLCHDDDSGAMIIWWYAWHSIVTAWIIHVYCINFLTFHWSVVIWKNLASNLQKNLTSELVTSNYHAALDLAFEKETFFLPTLGSSSWPAMPVFCFKVKQTEGKVQNLFWH